MKNILLFLFTMSFINFESNSCLAWLSCCRDCFGYVKNTVEAVNEMLPEEKKEANPIIIINNTSITNNQLNISPLPDTVKNISSLEHGIELQSFVANTLSSNHSPIYFSRPTSPIPNSSIIQLPYNSDLTKSPINAIMDTLNNL